MSNGSHLQQTHMGTRSVTGSHWAAFHPKRILLPKNPPHLSVLGINRHLPALTMEGQKGGFTNPFTTLLASHRNNVASLNWLGIPRGCCSEARGWYSGCCGCSLVPGCIIRPYCTLVHWCFPVEPPASDTPSLYSLGFSPESSHVRGHPTALARNSRMVAHLISCAVRIPGRVSAALPPGKHLYQHRLPDTADLTAVTPSCT